jgi:hypothetical protein
MSHRPFEVWVCDRHGVKLLVVYKTHGPMCPNCGRVMHAERVRTDATPRPKSLAATAADKAVTR